MRFGAHAILYRDKTLRGITGQVRLPDSSDPMSAKNDAVAEALKLETVKFAHAVNQKISKSDSEISQKIAEMHDRGLIRSGICIHAIEEITSEHVEDVALSMVKARKCSVVHVPDLASDAHLNELKNNIFTWVDSQGSGVPQSVLRPLGRLEREKLHPKIRERIKSAVALELRIVASEVKLGMNETPNQIVINVDNSKIASLNLGPVVGNINASIVVLAQQDNSDIAQAIKELTEAVSESPELEEQDKPDLVEAVEEIARQAAQPTAQRKPGVVKSLVASIHTALSAAANLGTIWNNLGPKIASYFGIPFP